MCYRTILHAAIKVKALIRKTVYDDLKKKFCKDDFKSYGFYRGLKIVSGFGKT